MFRIDDDGHRVALRRIADGVYRSKDENREFTISELAAIANDHPERFSPGVMLRPVVQDNLLPTVCYFGGAAEIAYFAQNCEAYKVLGRPVTPILHRQSFTVIEAKHRRTLNKFDLGLADMFAGFDGVFESIGRTQLSADADRCFTSIENTLDEQITKLDHVLSRVDPTLSDSLAKRRRKMTHHITALRKSVGLASARKDKTVERQIRAAFGSLLPNGELQERVLNVYSFLNKYGEYFVDFVYDAIDLNNKDHRIVEL
jgi:uncharacterized protein YllA (UPF0747 family)